MAKEKMQKNDKPEKPKKFVMIEGVKYSFQKTQIIFFDLEFYVPKKDQNIYSFSANPFKKDHLLLGGTFLNWKPLLEKNNKTSDSFWLWKYNNDEKQLVNAIVTYLEKAWDVILSEKGQCELCLCGIGISRVDIGYLYSKALQHKVRSEDKLFMIFHNIRLVELENAVMPYFVHENGMLLGKSTGQILKRFDIPGKHTSGSNVWELYEKESFEKIEQRNTKEVDDCFEIYKKLVDERPILKRKPKK